MQHFKLIKITSKEFLGNILSLESKRFGSINKFKFIYYITKQIHLT